MSGWRETVLDLMKVPHEPAPPPGGHTRIFRAAPNYFYFKLAVWIASQAMFVAGLVFVLFIVTQRTGPHFPRPVAIALTVLEAGGLVVVIARIVFGYPIVLLDYELRWYMISDRAIRIREGIITVREKTIALANVQNVSVKQGPLQRFFGIADVEVRTAGGGSGPRQHKKQTLADEMHVGHFRGVDNAAELRDIVMAAVRQRKDSGVGDPEEEDPATALVGELRAVRAMLER